MKYRFNNNTMETVNVMLNGDIDVEIGWRLNG